MRERHCRRRRGNALFPYSSNPRHELLRPNWLRIHWPRRLNRLFALRTDVVNILGVRDTLVPAWLNYTSKRFDAFSRGNLCEHFAVLLRVYYAYGFATRYTIGYVDTGYVPTSRFDCTILSRLGAVYQQLSHDVEPLITGKYTDTSLGSENNGATSSDWWHKKQSSSIEPENLLYRSYTLILYTKYTFAADR